MEEPRRTRQDGTGQTTPGGPGEPGGVQNVAVPERALDPNATPIHVVEFDDEGSEPVGTAVVEAVAEIRDISPASVFERTSDTVDPDALERLFEPSEGDGELSGWLTFEFAGTWVTVTTDRQVRIYDPEASEF